MSLRRFVNRKLFLSVAVMSNLKERDHLADQVTDRIILKCILKKLDGMV